MTINVVRLSAITLGIMLLSNYSFAVSELVTYKNAEYGFSFSYPSSWAREKPKSALGVIKISSAGGVNDRCYRAIR